VSRNLCIFINFFLVFPNNLRFCLFGRYCNYTVYILYLSPLNGYLKKLDTNSYSLFILFRIFQNTFYSTRFHSNMLFLISLN